MHTKTVPILTSILVSVILISVQASLAQTQYHESKIEFDQANYFTKKMLCYDINFFSDNIPEERKKATIIVTDPDSNKFNESIDRIKVFVGSDTDPQGIIITAFETHVNSGVFEGTVIISEEQSTQNKIHVTIGDSIYAKYVDTTLPQESKSESLEVTASSFIGTSCPPLERVPSSNPKILDNKGQEISLINADQQIQITAKIENFQNRTQPFAYLLQIQNEDGVTVSLSWLAGLLEPKQSMIPSQVWTPFAPGNYNVQIFVWESVDNPNALSPPLSLEVKVI